MATTASRIKLTSQEVRNLCARMVDLQADIAALLSYNSSQSIDWGNLANGTPPVDANGNIEGEDYSKGEVSNAIGSLDWVNKLLTNQSMTGSQANHLGNLHKLASP